MNPRKPSHEQFTQLHALKRGLSTGEQPAEHDFRALDLCGIEWEEGYFYNLLICPS
jgi:hypothetical protein